MSTTLDELHEEHEHLLPHIDGLLSTAAAVGRAAASELVDRLDRDIAFLRGHLVPHARAEDDVLYPVVAELLGGPDATATMRRDHLQVVSLTDELAALRDRCGTDDEALDDELRRVIYGLHAIIRLHFAEEEEIYVPLLEAHLDDQGAAELLANMDDAHRRHARD